MKPALIFIVTFIVALAGSAGAKVMMTHQLPPLGAADSAAQADSTAKTDTAVVESGHPVNPPVETPVHAAPVAADTTHTTAAAVGSHPDAGPAANDTTTIAAERRVSKLFTSMEAKQAAKVFEHMADSDVQIILGYVGSRQAAAIMAALPPERVATLSKLAMRGGAR